MENKEEFKYTDEMYIEDNRMCRWYLYKIIRCYPFLSTYENDLYSNFLEIAFKVRQKFNDKLNVKYSVYLFKSLKLYSYKYFKKYNLDINNRCISLDKPLADDDFTILDTFGYTYDFEANARYYDLICIVKKVILQFRNEKQQNILKLQLKYFNFQKVADKINCSKQYVNQVFENFKFKLYNQIIEEKFLDELEFKKKYGNCILKTNNLGTTKYSYLKAKFNLTSQMFSRYHKQYEKLGLTIDFESFLTEKLKNK